MGAAEWTWLKSWNASKLCSVVMIRMKTAYAAKPVLKATCIKQSPVIKGQIFVSHLENSSVNWPVLSKSLC